MTMTKRDAFVKARELAPSNDDLTDELVTTVLDKLADQYNYPADASFALYIAHDLADLALRLTMIGDQMQELADAGA